MEEIAFQHIADQHCIMMDGSSLGLLVDHTKDFTEPLTPDIAAYLRHNYNERTGARFYRYALQQLSSLVVYDAIVIDAVLLKHIPEERLAPFRHFKATTIPDQVRAEVTDTISEFIHTLPEDNRQWLEDEQLWDGDDKEYHDQLWDEYIRNPTRARLTAELFVNSTYSVPRLFYTYELADRLNVPLWLHPVKEHVIQRVRDLVTTNVLSFAQFEAAFEKQRTEREQALADKLYLARKIGLPPLTAYIFRYAEQRKMDLLTAAFELRGKPEAVAFRAWLRTVQTGLLSEAATVRQESLKELSHGMELAKKWGESYDIGADVKHKIRTLEPVEAEFREFPKVSLLMALLKATGLRKTFKDPILDRKPNWLFVTHWYTV